MTMRKFWMASSLLLLAACGSGYLTVRDHVVQAGTFKDAACETSKPADLPFDPCLCKANVKVPSTGVAEIDNAFADKFKGNQGQEDGICAGEAVKLEKTADIMSERQVSYTVQRNDDKLLAVLFNHFIFNAGAAHGINFQTTYFYSHKLKKTIDTADIIRADKRLEAAKAVVEALRGLNAHTYMGALWPQKLNPNMIFTGAGCDGCVIYPAKEGKGWKVVFQPYVAGPYSAGLVEVPLDASFINDDLK